MAGSVKNNIMAKHTHPMIVVIALLLSEVSCIKPPSESVITDVNTVP